jgi:hypothetical protein
LPASWAGDVTESGTSSWSSSKPQPMTTVTPVPLPMASVAGGLPTPLMAWTAPLFISAIAVTPASNGT